MEFFMNIWNWAVANSKEIVTVVTSANFVSFITSIVLLGKTLKATKNNTDSSKTLNGAVDSLNGTLNVVSDTNVKVNELENNVKEIDKKFTDFKLDTENNLSIILEKLNAMMEVQTLVYSTVKDDNIRNNVNTILTSAKYKETSTVAELKNTINGLQDKLNEKAIAFKEELVNTVKEASKIKEVINEVKETKLRV